MSKSFDDVIREYIDFVNRQVGVYMDACAGFAGNRARVERQVHRINRPVKRRKESGEEIVVWASYEDSTKPDVIHNRITRASEYIAANAEGGSNEQQHAHAIVIFLFTYWEDEIRPRLAKAQGVAIRDIRSDAMGDLRLLRHAILHTKAIIRAKKYRKLKKVQRLVAADQPIRISYDGMHQIFILVKQDLTKLLFEWLGVKVAPVNPEQITDIAIQKLR